MVARSAGLDTLRTSLVRTGSAYLRNVAWLPGVTCGVCAGVPGVGYNICRACSQRSGAPNLADQLGFITYAWPQHQSGHVMYGYKASAPTPASRTTVATLLTYGIVAHWPCIAGPVAEYPDAWATVPSLKGRVGVHPITQLAQYPLKSIRQVPVTPSPRPVDRRGFRPENFSARPNRARHVLVVDDTWTSGGHAQSVAAALKNSGARSVTILAVARWLEPTWAETQKVINSLERDFDPDICPFTGDYC